MNLQWSTVSRTWSNTDLVMSIHSLLRSFMQGALLISLMSQCTNPCFLNKQLLITALTSSVVTPEQTCGLLAQCSLSDRLGSHSQLEKQRALSRLVKSLLACQLDSQQLEPQHNVLCLVYWLARRPLDSAYTPPDSEGVVPGQRQTQWQKLCCYPLKYTLVRGSAHVMLFQIQYLVLHASQSIRSSYQPPGNSKLQYNRHALMLRQQRHRSAATHESFCAKDRADSPC